MRVIGTRIWLLRRDELEFAYALLVIVRMCRSIHQLTAPSNTDAVN